MKFLAATFLEIEERESAKYFANSRKRAEYCFEGTVSEKKSSLRLTEFYGKLGEFCKKLGEFALPHK